MQTLEAEALADFLPEESQGAKTRPIPIAVNSDSLATWFLGALSQLNQRYGYLFDVRVDDQDHTLGLLRDGSVLGAVTAESVPVQGCTVEALGAMRYQAIAAPKFVAHHFPVGVDAASLAKTPMIVFDRKDELQWRFVRRITRAHLAPPIHYLPTATGFIASGRPRGMYCPGSFTRYTPVLAARCHSFRYLAEYQCRTAPGRRQCLA